VTLIAATSTEMLAVVQCASHPRLVPPASILVIGDRHDRTEGNIALRSGVAAGILSGPAHPPLA